MKVTFEVNEVLPKLTDVVSVIDGKNSVSILSDVCISVNNESIILTASDGENWVTERADVLASDMQATFCTVAKDIVNCLKSLSDENVTLTLDEESGMMTLDYVSGRISLPYEPSEDFPRPNLSAEGSSETIVNGNLVKNLIKIANTATENSVVQPVMSGVHFGFRDGLMIVNGACHKKVVKLVEKAELNTGAEFSHFTLPPKASFVITKVLDGMDEDVKIRFTDKTVSVSNRNLKITARLLEGNYPNCDAVIPKNNTVNIEVEKERILQALKHVLSIENANRLVVLSLSGESITVSAEDVNYGRTSEESVKCKNYTNSEMSICFNGEVLSESLRSIDGESVVIEMSESKRPAILYSNSMNGNMVLMPMVMQNPVV